jgi:hypothetical protein
MGNRRELLSALIVTCAAIPVFTKPANSQEFLKLSGEEILNRVAVDIQKLAENDAAHLSYANLAYMQLQYRVDTNFNEYEAGEGFSKGAFSAISETLFNKSIQDQIAKNALPQLDFEKFRNTMSEAFNVEKERYWSFLQRFLSELEGNLAQTLNPDLLLTSLAYYAVSLAAAHPEKFEEASNSSWIWPFCMRKK